MVQKQEKASSANPKPFQKADFLPTLMHLSFFFLKNYLLKIFYRKKIKEYKYLRKLLATDNLFLFTIFYFLKNIKAIFILINIIDNNSK